MTYLVTTALEETWPPKNETVLFLGEWCCRYDRESAWKDRNARVAPYHWDDRQKLLSDYQYLQTLYEKLIREVANQLNKQHCVTHSLRFWRILIGPWLGYFVQILFDRWFMLRQALGDNQIDGVRVLLSAPGEHVPNDSGEFMQMLASDDWNESIYAEILDCLGFSTEKIAKKPLIRTRDQVTQKQSSIARQCRFNLARIVNALSRILYRDDDYFLIASYQGVKQDLLLHARLGRLPKLWLSIPSPMNNYDYKSRQWCIEQTHDIDEFARLTRLLIPRHIPKIYLEGYQTLVSMTEDLPWPKRPKAILTAISYSSDDVFKAWAGIKCESGVPLVISQHGGTYGMALWNFTEDHQIAIADRFLTWGWCALHARNVEPVGKLTKFVKKLDANSGGDALIVQMSLPRYSYHMYSGPVAAGQWLSYFDDQCRFVEALPAEIYSKLLVRIFAADFGHCQRQRWYDRFPDIRLDRGEQSIVKLLEGARIYISTYNATTYLESLSLNFPTIMFWNPKHWELRDSALPYFQELKSVGIFHETPESAARQMIKVWDDVPGWWLSDAVQTVRRSFCDRYAHIPKKPMDVLANFFRSVAHS